jgi:hypothetical protein
MTHEIPKNVDELIARLCETSAPRDRAEEALRCRGAGRPLGRYTSGTLSLLVMSFIIAKRSSCVRLGCCAAGRSSRGGGVRRSEARPDSVVYCVTQGFLCRFNVVFADWAVYWLIQLFIC